MIGWRAPAVFFYTGLHKGQYKCGTLEIKALLMQTVCGLWGVTPLVMLVMIGGTFLIPSKVAFLSFNQVLLRIVQL